MGPDWHVLHEIIRRIWQVVILVIAKERDSLPIKYTSNYIKNTHTHTIRSFYLGKIFTHVAYKFKYPHAFSHTVFKQFKKKKKKEFQCFSFSLLPVKFQALKVSLDFSLWFFSDKSYFFFFFLQTSSMQDSTGIFCFSEKEKISLHLIPLDQGFLNLWVLGSVPRLHRQGPCQAFSSLWELKEEVYSKCLWSSSRVTRQPVLTA